MKRVTVLVQSIEALPSDRPSKLSFIAVTCDRQHQGSSGGPSPQFDTSMSPPMSDFGMDIGQISAPPGLSNANAGGAGTFSRSSSFSTGSGGAFGEVNVERSLAAHVGLSGRPSGPSRPKTAPLSRTSSFASFG